MQGKTRDHQSVEWRSRCGPSTMAPSSRTIRPLKVRRDGEEIRICCPTVAVGVGELQQSMVQWFVHLPSSDPKIVLLCFLCFLWWFALFCNSPILQFTDKLLCFVLHCDLFSFRYWTWFWTSLLDFLIILESLHIVRYYFVSNSYRYDLAVINIVSQRIFFQKNLSTLRSIFV